jgi:hypothetical protein
VHHTAQEIGKKDLHLLRQHFLLEQLWGKKSERLGSSVSLDFHSFFSLNFSMLSLGGVELSLASLAIPETEF